MTAVKLIALANIRDNTLQLFEVTREPVLEPVLESGKAGVKNQAEVTGFSAGNSEARFSARSVGNAREAFIYPVVPVEDREFSDFSWDVEALASREGRALGEPFVISLAELAEYGGGQDL